MKSLSQASEILEFDSHDAPANQYMGWWHLSHEIDEFTAVKLLILSIDSGELTISSS